MIIQQLFHKIKTICHRLFITPYHKYILGSIGYKTYIPQSVDFEMPENIYIGNMVNIGRLSWLAANPQNVNSTCSLIIGDSTIIGSDAHIYCSSKIEIGNNVLIAKRVYISDNLHSYSDIHTPILYQPLRQLKNVYVGEGAWIGENVCIIGADIGKQSVIGSNSVVTNSIPDYCVAVGAPARIVKRYSFEKQSWVKTDKDGNII